MQLLLNMQWLDALSIWLAATALILIITSEIIYSNYGKITILIKRKRLRIIALIVGLTFMVTIFIKLYAMSLN